jgi:hypothetical protein
MARTYLKREAYLEMQKKGIVFGALALAAAIGFLILVIWRHDVRDFLRKWDAIIPPLVNLVPLLTTHFARTTIANKTSRYLYYGMLFVFLGFIFNFFVHFSSVGRVHYFELVGATIVYAGFLFVVLSEIMIAGLSSVLTRWRGEIWVKELDYVYLVLGALGLAMSTNRLEIVDEKLSMPEYFGPFVLATALVVRAIKTRAEINAWNKV